MPQEGKEGLETWGSYFNYFTEIEEFFVQKRGRHTLLSPLDWTLVETWQEMGIPLHVALRGIGRAMEVFLAKAARGRMVNTLFYCNQAVMEEFDLYRASTGSGVAREDLGGPACDEYPPTCLEEENREPASDGLREAVEDFLGRRRAEVEALASESDDPSLLEAAERVLARLAEIRNEASRLETSQLCRLELALAEADGLLLPHLERAMGPDAMKTLRSHCRQELRHYRETLDATMYGKILDNFVARRIRERFGLSDFSLLGLG